jgi:hypothetical protein
MRGYGLLEEIVLGQRGGLEVIQRMDLQEHIIMDNNGNGMLILPTKDYVEPDQFGNVAPPPRMNALVDQQAGGKKVRSKFKQTGGSYSCPTGNFQEKFTEHNITEKGDNCTICLERMSPLIKGHLVKLYPCCHAFHTQCIVDAFHSEHLRMGLVPYDPNIDISTIPQSCPLCRTQVYRGPWWFNTKSKWVPVLDENTQLVD